MSLGELLQQLSEAFAADAISTGTRTRNRLLPPASRKEIQSFEKQKGIVFPPSFREFLSLHNGWVNFRNDDTITGAAGANPRSACGSISRRRTANSSGVGPMPAAASIPNSWRSIRPNRPSKRSPGASENLPSFAAQVRDESRDRLSGLQSAQAGSGGRTGGVVSVLFYDDQPAAQEFPGVPGIHSGQLRGETMNTFLTLPDNTLARFAADRWIREADLTGAELRHADLAAYLIMNSDMSEARLDAADLSNARLEGVNLADIGGSIALDRGVDARLPPGLRGSPGSQHGPRGSCRLRLFRRDLRFDGLEGRPASRSVLFLRRSDRRHL